jgi:large subunit ribosomal protein L29
MKENLTTLSDSDIQKEIQKSSEEVRKARFQFAVTRSLENPKLINKEKRRVARLLTIVRERELEKKGKLKKNPGKKKTEIAVSKPAKGKKK